MIALELPHVNVLSKTDLVDEAKVESILDVESASVLWQREEYQRSVEDDTMLKIIKDQEKNEKDNHAGGSHGACEKNLDRFSAEDWKRISLRRKKQNRLTEAICSLLDDYSMVSFIPLNITDEDSIDNVLAHVDHTIQYGEDLEVRGADGDDFDTANEGD
jgi:hypothetical protein